LSGDQTEVHEIFFILFNISHMIGMLLSIRMTQWYVKQERTRVQRGKTPNKIQVLKYSEKALKYRIRVGKFVVSSYVFMLLFFITAQGNGSDWWSFCTVNGWYSMFGLFEWLFLWSAMVFHMIEHVDMYYMSVAWVVSGGRSGSVVVL
jgi:hypothetical protein